jgi:sec-independent protein translocase protein TatA
MLAEIFGPDLLIVVLVIVVVLFGGAAIPKLARNMGSAKKEFEKGMKEGNTDGTPAEGQSATPTANNNGSSVNQATPNAAGDVGPTTSK